jgi:SAM-dependent methyltransferase
LSIVPREIARTRLASVRTARRLLRPVKRLPLRALSPVKRLAIGDPTQLTDTLIRRRLAEDAAAASYMAAMTDEQALAHYGGEEPLVADHLRLGIRYFHAWRIERLRARIGGELEESTVLDVGDSDGLMLRALGKQGTAVNTLPGAIDHIRSNGVEAVLARGESLPFADASFDHVLCFQTLEHVEDPYSLLVELGRVARRSIFVSIPGVLRTHVLPRVSAPRGTEHCFEFDREDFIALTTHTPLEVVWDDVCRLLGRVTSPLERYQLRARRNDRGIFASTFTEFRMFELRHRSAA